MSLQATTWTVDIGNYTGNNALPLWYLPDTYGGYTILGAKLVASGAGTSVTAQLVTLSDAGTPVINGTIAAFAGTVVFAEGVTASATVSTPFVNDGQWIGLDQASGTAATHTWLTVYLIPGR